MLCMAQRLVDLYAVGDVAEVTFGDGEWLQVRVRQLQHPGLWVETADGRLWFVTNTRHIREWKKQ